MRLVWLLASSSLLLGAMGACAAAGDENSPPSNPEDSGTTSLPPSDGGGDSGTAAEDAADALDSSPSTCSPAGWCATPLPDSDLTFKDIWALSGRAFALATSPTLGTRVLEWTDAANQWTYIDDSTQNGSGLSKYVGTIWAPSDNEVYFTVSPGTIYHGVRPTAPETEWTWTSSRLDDFSRVPGVANAGYIKHYSPSFDDYAVGVWGTGPDDIYAWYLNTIFHWKPGDDGVPAWIVEYSARDVPESNQDLYFLEAAGTGQGDIWFVGTRPGSYSSCAFVVHKTADGYERVADGILSPSATTYGATCVAPPGSQVIGGNDGWIGSVQAPAPGVAVMLNSARSLVRLTKEDAAYTVASATVPLTMISNIDRTLSLWAGSASETWISGKGIVARVDNAWDDGGVYTISTLALSGAPVRSDLLRIRGTSNTNLWAIGAGYALHKTSP